MEYYINSQILSTNTLYPYNMIHRAAPDFKVLLEGDTARGLLPVHLQDGDTIYVYGEIPPLTGDIVINASVSITRYEGYPNPKAVVYLYSDATFMINAAEVSVSHIDFRKSTMINSNMMKVTNAASVLIYDCSFEVVGNVYSESSIVSVLNSDEFKFLGNTISPAQGMLGSVGLDINNSSYVDVNGNAIDIGSGSSTSRRVNIHMDGVSVNNLISECMLGGGTSTDISSIKIDENAVYVTIYNNVIYSNGEGTYGVQVLDEITGVGYTKIHNNVFIVTSDSTDNFSIMIPNSSQSTLSVYEIINNSFIYYDSTQYVASTFVNIPPSGLDSAAMYIDIKEGNGEIDYNNFYGFLLDKNIIHYSGAVGAIDTVGSHNMISPPYMAISFDSVLSLDKLSSYYSHESSSLIGSGKNQHDIGVVSAWRTRILSIRDTVTYDFGKIGRIDSNEILSLQNDVFTDTAYDFNKWYRSNTSAYPGSYNSQFEWEYNNGGIEWGYVYDSVLYDGDYVVTLKNRDKLNPYPDIECGVNPGYGFSAYPGYPNGVFGYSRMSYSNGCDFDCVIQDVYTGELSVYSDTTVSPRWVYQDVPVIECHVVN